MDVQLIGALGQFGFAGAVAILSLLSYRDLIPRLLQIVAQNSEALAKSASALHSNTESIKWLMAMVQELEDAVIRLEQRGDE